MSETTITIDLDRLPDGVLDTLRACARMRGLPLEVLVQDICLRALMGMVY